MGHGNFEGRKARVETVIPVPVKTVHMEVSVEEARVLQDAVYFYWACFARDGANGSYWHNSNGPSTVGVDRGISDAKQAEIAQDFYDEYLVGF